MHKDRLVEKIAHHMAVAKVELARRSRLVGDDEFVKAGIVILPDGSEHEVALAFYDRCEQQGCFAELSAACRALDASALIIRAKALLLSTEQIRQELVLNGSDRTAYRAAIARWVHETAVDGRVMSLPPKYQKWCLLVVGLGPGLPALGLVQYYDRTGHDTSFVGEPTLSVGMEFPLIRKWWQ